MEGDAFSPLRGAWPEDWLYLHPFDDAGVSTLCCGQVRLARADLPVLWTVSDSNVVVLSGKPSCGWWQRYASMVRLKPGGVERHKEIQNFQRPIRSTYWYNLRAQQMGKVKVEANFYNCILILYDNGQMDGSIVMDGLYRWQWIAMKKDKKLVHPGNACSDVDFYSGKLTPFAQGKNSSSQRLQLLCMDGLWSLIGWKIRLLI